MTGSALEAYDPGGSTISFAPEAWKVAQRIARTEFVPAALRGKPESVLAAMLTGHELGVGPMQALNKIHVIEGRPALAAELMRALVFQHGHELWIEESSSTTCTVAGRRQGSERESRVTWTLDDARRANLVNRDNWKRYPSAMLLARASAQLCRMMFPDVLAGISYTLEELADGDFVELDDDLRAEVEARAASALGKGESSAPARARRAATRGAPDPGQGDPPPPKTEREEAPLPGEEEAVEGELEDLDEEPDAGQGDDDVVDAEVVEEKPDPLEETIEPPDRDEGARAYSGPQIIAMRCGALGVTDRAEKLKLVAAIVGREIASSNELTPEEIRSTLEVLADEGDRAYFFDALRAEAPPAEAEAPAVEEPPAAPAPTGRRRRVDPPAGPPPSTPSSWDAEGWRAFLGDRGVKVSEVLREATKLAREREGVTAPGTFDDLAGHELAAELVGFVEDLSLERKAAKK